MFRLFCLVLISVLIPAAALPAVTEPNGRASHVIGSLNSALLDVMKNADALRYPGRYAKLAPVIESTHNLEYIARFSIGNRNWERLTAEQREQFVRTFREYSVATYAHQFNGYSGEAFRVTGEQAAKRGQIQVSSVLEIPGEENVEFIYLLLPDDAGTLKILNIIVQGVSDLALKRAEFMSLLDDKGFDALIAHLVQKTAEYASTDK